MKLTLRNLGRLAEASIDLDKDLILLTGPNNTSKTYVAHAIYGLWRRFWPMLTRSIYHAMRDSNPGSPADETRLTIDLIDYLDQNLPQLLQGLASGYCEALADVFAASEDFASHTSVSLDLEKGRLSAAKEIFVKQADEDLYIQRMGTLHVRKAAGTAVFAFERTPEQPGLVTPGAAAAEQSDTNLWPGAVAYIVGQLGDRLFKAPRDTHILTAERAAIQLFSRELSLKRTELVDELLQMTSSVGQRRGGGEGGVVRTLERRAQRYPLAIRESLLIANDLAAHKIESSPVAPLADRLERDLLGGAIHVDDEGTMMFVPESSGAGLNLHLASSSVKSVAALSFFLRHLAKKNQLLIIDEPELNLHPDNQRKVARVLARLARSGIKVLISTHSDYVIREINNLIMLSADHDGALRQRLGYDEEETLAPEQVGAYLFHPTGARPIEVAPTGIEVETIDREINALNSVSQDIYFSLFNKAGA
jgi:hypothetical protein